MSRWKNLVARWGSSAGETDDVRIDASTNSLQTVNYEHHEIHSGSHYFIEGTVTLGDGGEAARTDEIVLKADTTYLRTFLSGSAGNIVSFKASWYEHQDKN